MRPIKVLLLGLALAALSGAAATSVLAAPVWEQCAEGGSATKYSTNQCKTVEGTGKWQWSEVTGTDKVTIRAFTLTMRDTKTAIGETEVRCAGAEGEGKVGPGKSAVIEKVEVANAGAVCRGVKGGCETNGIEKVVGVHTPWQATLFETEKKVLTKIEADGGGEPGWAVTCKTALGSKTDTCESEATKLEEETLENVSSRNGLLVLATFEKKHKEKCSEGGAESGTIEGQAAILLAGGQGLRAGTAAPRVELRKEENPTWVYCEEHSASGTKWEDSSCTKASSTGHFEAHEMEAGETQKMEVEGGTQALDIGGAGGDKILCNKVKANKEAVSIGGEPGTLENILEYEECTDEGHAKCTIDGSKESGKIKTNTLTSKAVFTTKEAAEKRNAEDTAVVSKTKNSSAPFYNIEMSGECPKTGTFEVKGEQLLDIKTGAHHSTGHELEGAAGASYWFNEGGVTKEGTAAVLKSGTEEFSYHPVLVVILVVLGLVKLGTWLFN
jgi:hypothetical protein